MNKKLKKQPIGESLIEVITAIFVLVIGSSVAVSIVVNGMQTNNFNRDSMLALNLAIEGVEAMRTIRDNNWLRFAYDKEKCWDIAPEKKECEDGNKIPNGNYIVDLDKTYSWNLNKIDSLKELDLNSGLEKNADFRLKIQDRGGAPDKQNIYVSAKGATLKDIDSPFYRMITIKTEPSADQMNVTSAVQWLYQGQKHEIKITNKLSNYESIK